MSLDSEYLRSVRHRQKYKERSATPLYLFNEQTRELVKLMGRYFKQFRDCQVIDKGDFLKWVSETQGDKLTDTKRTLYDALMDDFDCPLTKEGEQFLTDRVQESDLVYRTADLLEKWNSGEEIDVIDLMKAIADKAAFSRDDADGIRTVKQSIREILETSGTDWGFKWGDELLGKAMRPAQPGDMILVAARPDSGKTTFVGYIVRPWMPQVDELFPEQNRKILWLNNEGPGSRIKLRVLQSHLGLTIGEMSQYLTHDDPEALDRLYEEHFGDKLVIMDIHGKNTAQVERKIEETNPAVIIWDMLDHVKYVSEDLSRVARTDEYLEGLYRWVREMGVRHNAVNIVTTQLSGDAENHMYPTLGMLKDSKTGKQGQADAIITFGAVSTYPNTRYIGLTKNKLNMGRSSMKLGEVYFDGARGAIKQPEAE